MNVSFHQEAKWEYEAAVRFYHRIDPTLARLYVSRVEEALEAIRQHPAAFRKVDDEVRRCLLKQSSFGLFYTLRDEQVLVWAVMHLNRKPGYWKERRR